MLELGTFGSVRGVSGNGHPYRNPPAGAVSQVAVIAWRLSAISANSSRVVLRLAVAAVLSFVERHRQCRRPNAGLISRCRALRPARNLRTSMVAHP